MSPSSTKPTRKRRAKSRGSEPRSAISEASASGDERKERVLHTRVPDSLDRQLRNRARNLGMSVSTIVRHVLLNTFGLVEDIVTDSTNVALSIAGADDPDFALRRRGEARVPRAAGNGDAEVIAWHEAVLNRNAVCDRCNVVLRMKSRAAVGLRDRPGPQVIRCLACLGDTTAGPDGALGKNSARERRPPRRRKRES